MAPSLLAKVKGKSRFSKALPQPPPPPSQFATIPEIPRGKPQGTTANSPLPPLPKKMAPTIKRRPVGGSTASQQSVNSATSIYSDSPGFSRSSTPPLPPKDEQTPQTPKKDLASLTSSLNYSPPNIELWRRRSQKSDKGVAFSELHLTKSNGSTATPPQKELPTLQGDLPPLPQHLPRSSAGRKPVAGLTDDSGMGSKLSKLKNEHKKKTAGNSDNDGSKGNAQNRLPTPEYLKTDRQPLPPKVLSPASPETPPNDNATPRIPPRSESRDQNSSRGSDVSTIVASTQTSKAHLPTTDSSLNYSHSREPSDTLTITSEAPVMRSPQPQKSIAPSILTLQPRRSPSGETTSSPLLPSPRGLPSGVRFPTLPTLLPPGSVIPGAELDITHLKCYQNHQNMRSAKNDRCPVACMVCQRKDTQQRWRCTWCCLSACASCMKTLTSVPGQDLRVTLERIGR